MSEVPALLEPFIGRLRTIYGASVTEQIVRSMNRPKRVGYFLNPLVDAAFEPRGEPVDDLDGCFSVPAEDRAELLEHQAVDAGAVYPINPSSVLAVRALALENMALENATEVLDLAAAPGGKTLLMAAAMENSGRIAAVESVKGRFHRMRANLGRCGVTNVQFYLADGRSIGRKVPDRFDRVLLDAPCSSESRIRLERPDTYDHWKLRKVKECARKQRGLIRSAFAALKPGGEMIYCTCSFAPEENELVVSGLLESEPAADLLPIAGSGVPGLVSWQSRRIDERIHQTLRILPDDLWDGFYIARIKKLG